MHNALLFTKDIDFNLVYGTANLLPGLIFYAIFRQSLITKKWGLFVTYTVFFLIGLHYYMTGVYLAVGHIGWLPEKLRHDALRWSEAKVIHFSVIYMFREFLCIGALAYFIYSAKQGDQLRKLKEQQLLTELTYLKAQLHPHFFFNTLNNIYSLALKRSSDTAPLVAKLADMMRYVLYDAEQGTVPLNKEIAFLTNYIEAEKIRQHSNNKITFDVQGIKSNAVIEPLLLLPFIENAFKHGLYEETDNGFVHIVICQSDTELIVQVNNSKPISPQETKKGIGLQNAIKRLNLLYDEKYRINIKDDTNAYHLNLSLQTND